MIKQQTVARFMAFSAVFPVIFFTVLIATALYFINQQLIEQKITNYSWQFGEFNNGSLLLNHIDFTYNNQLDIRLEKIRFSSIDPSAKKTTFPFFSASLIEIGRIKVKILPKIQTQELPKNTLKETVTRLQAQINNLQSQPEWLAFLPQKIDLTSILIQAPCAIGTCSLTGAGSLQLLSSHPKIQLKAQLKLYDQQITSPYIDNELMVSFANPTKSKVKPVQSELLTYHFTSQIKTTASAISLIELSQTGQLSDTQTASIHSEFSGFLPAKNRSINPEWHNLQTLFQNWTSHSLDLNRLTPYLPIKSQENDTNREDKNSNKTDFGVLINTTFPLDSIAKADSSPHLLQQLSKMAITSEIQAEFNAPFPIPNIGSIQGSAKAKLALKDGAIQHYDLDAKGVFHRTQPITLFDQQENPVFKKLAFTVSSSQIDPTTLNELSALPFKLSVNAISLVPLQQVNSKNSLFAEGTLQLNADPSITVTKGQFTFAQDAFRLNNQKVLKNLSAKGHFTAELQPSLIKFETPQFQAGGDYYDKQLNLHLKQLQINSDTLSVQSQNPAQFLQHLQASAKNINITGDLLLSPQQEQTVSVKNIDLLLSKTELKPTPQSQNKSNPSLNNKTLKTQYRINIARLEQQNLQPISWTLRGKATSELSETFDSLHQSHIQGSISNQAGLVVFHNAFYKPNHLYADWELPNIYFLAGNPMQKTFKDWPKQLTLGSGQFKAKGNSQLYLSSLTAYNNL
ncbi:MAG: hypothetical protein R3254_08905, partial [Thiomicrorhabdus sp.]|nr:hypothetical protein [Thiomicrorhabdus sp.]